MIKDFHQYYFWKKYVQALIQIITADICKAARCLLCYKELHRCCLSHKIQNINIKYNTLWWEVKLDLLIKANNFVHFVPSWSDETWHFVPCVILTRRLESNASQVSGHFVPEFFSGQKVTLVFFFIPLPHVFPHIPRCWWLAEDSKMTDNYSVCLCQWCVVLSPLQAPTHLAARWPSVLTKQQQKDDAGWVHYY